MGSGSESYTVSDTCTCNSARYHGPWCKHMIAVVLHRYAWDRLHPAEADTPAPVTAVGGIGAPVTHVGHP